VKMGGVCFFGALCCYLRTAPGVSTSTPFSSHVPIGLSSATSAWFSALPSRMLRSAKIACSRRSAGIPPQPASATREQRGLTRVLVVDDRHVHDGLDPAARAHAVLHVPRAVGEDAEEPDEVALQEREAVGRGAARAALTGCDHFAEHHAREELGHQLQHSCMLVSPGTRDLVGDAPTRLSTRPGSPPDGTRSM
jgi:hypothetical protein